MSFSMFLFRINFRYNIQDQKPSASSFSTIFSYSRVAFDKNECFPIMLLNNCFSLPAHDQRDKKYSKALREQNKELFQDYFFAIIWCTYRKNFNPLLSDFRIKAYIEDIFGSAKTKQVSLTTDSAWGCTIR